MRLVAEVIGANPRIVLDKTISELAAACATSVASVVRFCRVLGLSGYAQLRMELAAELGREAAQFGGGLTLGAEIASSDSLQDMAAKVAALEMLAIDETVTSLDFAALERVVVALDMAERILLFGIGASRFVAQDLHHKLFRIGRNVFLLADSHEAWSAALLSPPGGSADRRHHRRARLAAGRGGRRMPHQPRAREPVAGRRHGEPHRAAGDRRLPGAGGGAPALRADGGRAGKDARRDASALSALRRPRASPPSGPERRSHK
jgi:hypothetical protein